MTALQIWIQIWMWVGILVWLLWLLVEIWMDARKRARQVRQVRERLARAMSADVRQCSRMPAEESEGGR